MTGLLNGWVVTTIGDVCGEVARVTPQKHLNEPFRYIDISSIDSTKLQIVDTKEVTPKVASPRARQVVKEGDTLLSTTRVYLRNIAIVPAELDGQIASTAFCVLRPLSSILDSKYLNYYVRNQNFINDLTRLQRGNSPPAVLDEDVRSQPFPLAPLNEQRRIVSKIEELFSDLDEGEAALRRVQSLLAGYRQAVLKAAVTGELTKEWREANQHRLESGEALLQRILQARREQWNGRGQYQEPQPPDIDELPDLPEGWVWASIDQLFNVYVGSTPSRKEPSYWGGDIPWVSSGEVAFCRISDTKEKITRQGYENSSVKLHPKGTVLLAMIGEGRTRGQAAILDIEACHNQNSASIRVSETDIPPGYIYYLLMYSYEQNRRMGQGGNQPALNGMKIKGLTVPLAPLEEMKEIVNQIEIISSRIDALEIWCKTELARSATLRQSILKAAFSGKLVLQDPGDEPASVLLERIQAARPSPSPSKPTSRTGAKTQPKGQPTLWESS